MMKNDNRLYRPEGLTDRERTAASAGIENYLIEKKEEEKESLARYEEQRKHVREEAHLIKLTVMYKEGHITGSRMRDLKHRMRELLERR